MSVLPLGCHGLGSIAVDVTGVVLQRPGTEELRDARRSQRECVRRQTVAVSCVAVVIVLLMFSIAGVAAVAVLLGIDVFATWIVSLIEPLMGPPLFAVIGAALVPFAGWALFRLATGHAPPGTSRRDMIIAVMVVVGLALLGAGFLLAAFAPQASDTSGF